MLNTSSFAERLSEFMIINNVNAPAVATQIGVSRMTVAKYLRGKSAPATKALIALADYFHCSTDYLLGLTEDYPENQAFKPATKRFSQRFSSILKETGVSQYSLTQEHHISGNLLYGWLHEDKVPSSVNLVKLSEILDCSVDFILGRSDI